VLRAARRDESGAPDRRIGGVGVGAGNLVTLLVGLRFNVTVLSSAWLSCSRQMRHYPAAAPGVDRGVASTDGGAYSGSRAFGVTRRW